MLVKLLENGYGNEQKLNCAQKILFASNEAYELGLNEEALGVAGGFGGGMGIESTCGALTAGIMVLGRLFPAKDDESKKYLTGLVQEYLNTYKDKMNSIECAPLKKEHRNDEIGCKNVIIASAKILDTIVQRELNK